jgi:hypothetical protein
MEEIIFLGAIAIIFSLTAIWLFTPWGKKWRRVNGIL